MQLRQYRHTPSKTHRPFLLHFHSILRWSVAVSTMWRLAAHCGHHSNAPAEYAMKEERTVCSTRHVSVCLLVTSSVSNFTYRLLDARIFMKILPEKYLSTRKSALNFGSHPDLEIYFKWISTIVWWGNSAYFPVKSKSCRQILVILFRVGMSC